MNRGLTGTDNGVGIDCGREVGQGGAKGKNVGQP